MIISITITVVLKGYLLITYASLEGGRVKTKMNKMYGERGERGYLPVRTRYGSSRQTAYMLQGAP